MEFRYPTFEAIVVFNKHEVNSSSEAYKLEDENRLRKILEGIVFGRINLKWCREVVKE
ncbi:MAG: hypothetical protein QXU32_12820 [Nitrososphaerales archaeon]